MAFGALDPLRDAGAREELSTVDSVWGASREQKDRWLEMFVDDYWRGEGAWAALRDDARNEVRRVGWVAHQGVTTLVPDATPAPAYAALTCPVQLFSGERSPRAGRRVVGRLAEALPNADAVTVPDAGHTAPLSHTDPVNDLIVKVLGPARPTD